MGTLFYDYFFLRTWNQNFFCFCAKKFSSAAPNMDGMCTVQGDGIPHPADMRSTIKIIERIIFPQALSAAQFCTIADYRNHDAAHMCVREFVRKVKLTLDDVREHLHLLQCENA